MANFNIINMTRRDIIMLDDNNNVIARYNSNRKYLKCVEDKKFIGKLDNIPIYSIKYTLDEQPPVLPNTFYIVSGKVLEASGFRNDFLTVVESSSKNNKVYITGLKRG